MSRIIYISGKITGDENYRKKFRDYELLIWRHGDIIHNPIDFTPFLWVKNWYCYMISCLWHLASCSHIYMLPDWKQSKGARIERKISMFFGLKVIYL